MDDLVEIAANLDYYKITIIYVSKLKHLLLNDKLPKQIAGVTNNFKRYLVRIENGLIKNQDELFDSGDKYVDWIITESNELLFGHGHAFLSGNAKNIKNAGTAIIREGKIITISNGSGHYIPSLEYLDEILPIFKKMEILKEDYRILKWKLKN